MPADLPWASPPGDTLGDLLAEQGISTLEAAQRLRLAPAEFEQLLVGHLPITPELAQALAGLGSTPEFWIRREANYRKYLLGGLHE